MKTATAEQKQRAAEKRERFRGLCKQIAGMSEAERAELVLRSGRVAHCEGHALSPRNMMLLFLQHPGVSLVGGFRQWLRAGRIVKRGEKSLSILVPCGRGKVTNADHEESGEGGDRVFFIAGSVFDVSHTEEMPADLKAADWEGGGE